MGWSYGGYLTSWVIGHTDRFKAAFHRRAGNRLDHNHEIWRILSDRGVPVEFVTYPRGGHGIGEPNHQRDMMQRNLEWFKKWVLGAE